MIDFFRNYLCLTDNDYIAIWTMITAICTSFIAIIAYFQLAKANKISQADFDQRFKIDFFNKETQQLFMLFQYNLLVFKIESVTEDDCGFPYFEIDRQKIDANHIFSIYLPENKYRYSSYEVDELLLGHFEDLGLFYRKKLMDIEFIYSGFSYYIDEIHKNDEVKKYIKWSRDNEGDEDDYAEDTFEDFDLIYKKVKCYEKRRKIYQNLKSKFRLQIC
jgi:hypothetical protein